MSTTLTDVKEGDIIASKYRVDKVLGVGGMGVVVAAHHVQLDERVAIKFLLPAALGDANVVERFAREARAAVKIKSDHVARVRDVGTLDSGAPYMVMEYLEGRDLAAELADRQVIPVPEAVDYVLQASEAMAEAHSLGIVHRDLKPANLFLTRRAGGLGWIKVLDFGISKMSSMADAGRMTSTSTILGSPYYMSPEQLTSSRNVDVRTDLWALGVILYELVTGHLPFFGETIGELCITIMSTAPTSASVVHPAVPPALDAVLARCLEKNRDQRFRNVAEVALALQPFGSERCGVYVDNVRRTITSVGQSVHPMVPGSAAMSSLGGSQPSIDNSLAGSQPAMNPGLSGSQPGMNPGLSGSQPGVAAAGVRTISAEEAHATSLSTSTQAAWGQTNASRSRTGAVAVLSSAALAMAGLGVGAWVYLGNEETAEPEAAAASSASAVSALAPAEPAPEPVPVEPAAVAPAVSATPTASASASAPAAVAPADPVPSKLPAVRRKVRQPKSPTPAKSETKAKPPAEPTKPEVKPRSLLDDRH